MKLIVYTSSPLLLLKGALDPQIWMIQKRPPPTHSLGQTHEDKKLNVDNDYFFLGEHNLLAVEYIVTSIVTGGGSDLSGWAGIATTLLTALAHRFLYCFTCLLTYRVSGYFLETVFTDFPLTSASL